jgi:hypothetical protein
MTDFRVFAMDTICTDVSVFLAAALVLALVIFAIAKP